MSSNEAGRLPPWRDVIAEYGSESALARAIGTQPQRVNGWLHGAEPTVGYVLRVAKVSQRSLPWLIAAAFQLPLDLMAPGPVDVAIHADSALDDEARTHYLRQYKQLVEATEYRRGPGRHRR